MTIKATEKLPSIEINPESSAEKTIIWLHGLGADGNDFAPIAPELNIPAAMNVRFIFPHAPSIPVTINNGYVMPAWFDIYNPDIGSKIDEKGILQSVSQITTLIEVEQERGISSENIILAGFSQGALIALTTGLQHPDKLAGIIALSGLLPNAATLIDHASEANNKIPIFMAHGTQDNMLPLSYGETANEALSNASFPVSWHTYPMAHGVCAEEIQDISQWIHKIWE